ncbi:unnamed protein product [Didymodactylos carnosus]|uniref:Transcription elongation factor S-II n=1 Tax=Didymodactylos carnosus TaxID=1234261 RepID=A0A814J9M0_9BILA|nr:unnamed protein product [Didymodactylos carnosus]CAF1032630.1 unnamed protein product [Didymodactylos carnosus]CAF3722072.1 unnamed protein product [Didymodactylos carnosus]CAF3803412.1 unnamed protein product [Didymodactylos carnosus]
MLRTPPKCKRTFLFILDHPSSKMAEEEIARINRKLEKMISNNGIDESIARDLLVRLQESRITLLILQKTGIGKTINNLRKALTPPNEDLATLAKGLLKNWKKLVPEVSKEDKITNNNHNSLPPTSTQNEKNETTTSKPNGIERSLSAASSTSIPSSLASNTHDEVRLKSRDLLAAALSVSEIPEGSADPVELAARVEDAIYKEIQDTGVKYKNRIRSRLANLKDLKNPGLRNNVLLGYITSERLASLTADEMASEDLKREREKLTKDAINEHQLAVATGIGTDLIQCGRCKQKNCTYTEAQTRSADEPMTLFVLCNHCGLRWKMATSKETRTAQTLLSEADKKSKASGGFLNKIFSNSSNVAEDARTLYVKAGNQAKSEGNYPLAVEAYTKALPGGEQFEQAACYENIAASYMMCDPSKAVEPFEKAAELHCTLNRFPTAAGCLEKAADVHEQCENYDKAYEALTTAQRFYVQERQKASAGRVKTRMANIRIQQRKYMDAKLLFEEMAELVKDDPMLRYGAKDHYFRAVLCSLCIDVDNGQIVFDKYTEENPSFDNHQPEVKLLRNIIQCLHDGNKEQYLQYIKDSPLASIKNDKNVKVLLEDIKKKLDGDIDLK